MIVGNKPPASRAARLPDPLVIDALESDSRVSLERLWFLLPEARLVGGAVRDLLAGRTASDLDLATPEPPDTVLSRLGAAGIKVVATGLAHGTVTAVLGGRPFEIITLREDTETDGRHARVSWTADWRADAARRDFTINAMSMDRDGVLHDFFGGAEDLDRGRVRFVGEAARRIEEDGLRILRFFRFQARFGRGEPDGDALVAIRNGLACLRPLSAERIWMELCRLLAGPEPGRTLLLMAESGVLEALLPGASVEPVLRIDDAGAPPDAVLRLAALACGDAKWAERIAARLKLSRRDAQRLSALVQPQASGVLDENEARRRLADDPPDLVLGRSWLAGEGNAARVLIAGTVPPVFPVSGRDAVQAGFSPGPEIGRMLAELRSWWRDGGCRADKQACLDRLRTVAAMKG